MLQSLGSQIVGHNLATKQQQLQASYLAEGWIRQKRVALGVYEPATHTEEERDSGLVSLHIKECPWLPGEPFVIELESPGGACLSPASEALNMSKHHIIYRKL